MPYTSELGELVLEIARRTFPVIVKDRTKEQVSLQPEAAMEFVTAALEKSGSVKSEIVMGCAFSALPGIYDRLTRSDDPVTWANVRMALITEFQSLRRRERYWNDYYKLFYEVVITCTATWYAKAIIRKFCRYLRFEGSVCSTDAEFAIFLHAAGVQDASESAVHQFIEYEHNYTLLPAAYRNRVVEQVIQYIYNLTRQIAENADRGGPYELLTVLNRAEIGLLKYDRTTTFEQLTTCYPAGNTSTNPLQRRLEAVLSGYLSDLVTESLPIVLKTTPAVVTA